MCIHTYINTPDTNLQVYSSLLFVLNQIYDLQKEEHVHTLGTPHTNEITVAVISHPTRPIFVTASDEGTIRVWDSFTYRYVMHQFLFICF